MDICIRADGGSSIGMGHIMRTLVLARELRKKHNVFYTCKADDPLTDKYYAGIDFIAKQGFKVVKIDEKEIIKDLKNIKSDCIITDSYDVDEEYFNALKRIFRISGCFDDEKICEYYNVDFLINQNAYAFTFDYHVNKDTDLILGNKYIILREEFRNIPAPVINKDIKDIMITVGGSDNTNITGEIINSLKNSNFNMHVVIGPSFKHYDELKKNENERIRFYFNPKMSVLMTKCDIAISSCGSTLYELAACGTPTIGIVIVDNQLMAAEYMSKSGSIIYSDINDLLFSIEELTYEQRKVMSISGKKLVDGLGVFRIIDKIEKRLNL